MSAATATITNDPESLLRVANLHAWRHSLPPRLGIDQFRTALPVLLYADGRRPAVFTKEIDRTNLEALHDLEAELVFHTPYFTFDAVDAPSDAHPTLADAVSTRAGENCVLDPRMSVSLCAELQAALGLHNGFESEWPATLHFAELNRYVVPRSAVPSRLARHRDVATQAAWSYVDALGCREAIAPWLLAPVSDPLSSLDELMGLADVDVIFCCTPLNLQELSGVPAVLFGPGDFALYARGDRSVHLLSCREMPHLGLPSVAAATAASVFELARGGKVGFEELNLPRSLFDAFGLATLDVVPASRLLRRWRELLTWEDLAYSLIGTQVTLTGINAALDLVADALARGRGPTELDAFDRYTQAVEAEIARLGLPIRIRSYFTHTHAGNRSGIPASATGHPLAPLTSLKIDAGLEIYDESGFHRATSDVTRSLVGSDDAREFYGLLEAALVEAVIPACTPGATGADVFEAGIGFLEPHREPLEAAGFLPSVGDGGLHAMVNRDIGHLLGKQEPATTVFEKGNDFRLEAGMIAAAELQWPYREWCIGVEDVFLVAEEGPINLTRAASG